MANFAFQWEKILEMAKKEGIPEIKKRAIIREYLQVNFLKFLYSQKESKNLHFIGGSSLRILHDLDRFSENLDFDNKGVEKSNLEKIFKNSIKMLEKLGLDIDFKFKMIKNNQGRGYLKFGKELLKDLEISPLAGEKLTIKLELTSPSWYVEREVVLMRKFDCVEYVVTNTRQTILAEKSLALLSRVSPRGRDIYDIFWLLSRNISPDLKTLKYAKINNYNDYKEKILKRYAGLKPEINRLKEQLRPFLVNEENVRYLDMFEDLIEKVFKQTILFKARS